MTNVIGVVCLMDDILVYGKSQAQHDDRLVKVLCRLKVSGLTLNSDKCKFSQSKSAISRSHLLGRKAFIQTHTKLKPLHKLNSEGCMLLPRHA